MRIKSSDDKPSEAQRREVNALLVQAGAVRGLQLFIALLGAALAVFDGRGWSAFIVGAGFAAWLQSQLPPLPPWAQRIMDMRDDN